METPLSVLLDEKEVKLVQVKPTDTVFDAVKLMNTEKVGGVVVTLDDALVGMFTERDVLVKIIGQEKDPKATLIEEVMTPNVQTVPPSMRVAGAMKLITEKRFRHLPIVEDGKLVGVISIGDLTEWVSRTQEIKIRDLENYIYGQ